MAAGILRTCDRQPGDNAIVQEDTGAVNALFISDAGDAVHGQQVSRQSTERWNMLMSIRGKAGVFSTRF